ncbi:MAG: sulfate transporter CysZ [Magnetococcales bacterium]|nr:sulfate transporter CysZ [Magnetococcales bacterium]
MNNSFVSGAGYLFRGLGLLTKPGIRLYAIIPLLINMALFALAIWYGYSQFELFILWANGFLPSWLQWLGWVLIPLFVVSAGVVIFFTFSVMANIVGAPFNSILALRVERYLGGQGPGEGQAGMKQFALRLIPLVWNEINKLAYSLLWTIPFLVLFIIPVVNVAAPFLWMLFSAWILAIQYADVPMGNHDVTGKMVRKQLRDRRAMSFGFGGITLLMTSIPFINFLVMPTAVAGATIMWVEVLSTDQKQTS